MVFDGRGEGDELDPPLGGVEGCDDGVVDGVGAGAGVGGDSPLLIRNTIVEPCGTDAPAPGTV